MAKLIVLGDAPPFRTFPLNPAGANTLGRHPSQTIQLLDRLVSKEHAIIQREGDGYVLIDLGSRNGTFVDEQRVGGRIALRHQCVVVLGGTRLRFEEVTARSVTPSHRTRVTLAPQFERDSAIAASLSHGEQGEFQSEARIQDTAQLRQDYERLRMAYQLQRDIANEVDLDRLLHLILDSLFQSLMCDRVAILVMDDSGQLKNRIGRTRDAQGDDEEFRISTTILDRVLKDKAALLSHDARIDPNLVDARSVILEGIRSTMCVPLIARTEVLGVIVLDSLFATNVFTDRDLAVVQGLADQAAMAIENSLLVKQRETDAQIRANFSRLLSPALVEQVVDGGLTIEKSGVARRNTVLFSDLRGFTAMSERLEPAEIVQMLNEVFERLVDVLFEHEGTLDKFMGDGIMAVFGSPMEVEDAPVKAVRAALQMQRAVADLNETRHSEGLEALRMGIGIDTGHLIAGYMGSTKTMNYTVIGPPVNLASRLCAVAQADEVLISKATRALVGDRAEVKALEPRQLKGIREPVTPFHVIRLIDTPGGPKIDV